MNTARAGATTAARGGRRAWRLALPLALAAAVAGGARAEWLKPDPTVADAQAALRTALADTAGHAGDRVRLDSLGAAQLRLGRESDAARVFAAALALAPGDPLALAGLGKLALFAGRDAEAESLLAGAGDAGTARADLYAARLRRGEWTAAAAMAESVDDAGRAPLLERLAAIAPSTVRGPDHEGVAVFVRPFPVPLVKVKLDGTVVLMAVDTGAPTTLVDPMTLAANGVHPIGGQRTTLWDGTRVAIQNALVPRLEVAGFEVTNLPVGVVSLHRMSLDVNPQGAYLAGVLGLDVMRRFSVSINVRRGQLELRPRGTAPEYGEDATRVPFELWGEGDLMVWGSVAGGRRMGLIVASGLPGGVTAPAEVCDELGIKPGNIGRFTPKGPGVWLAGRPWAQITVPTVTVGPLAFGKLAGWCGGPDATELWRCGVRRDALLGAATLERRRMTIDWERRQLVFEGY